MEVFFQYMKTDILNILEEYLLAFPNEKERQSILIKYIENHNDNQMFDWNNFDGHIVASGFIYAKEERLFLVLYHNDLKMFLYPGGHVNINDKNVLDAAKREVEEETGLNNLEEFKICENELIPIDIDTHVIDYNERLKLPKHYHFDFRYLFVVNNVSEVKLDTSELSNYKWISMEDLEGDLNYGEISKKLKSILK